MRSVRSVIAKVIHQCSNYSQRIHILSIFTKQLYLSTSCSNGIPSWEYSQLLLANVTLVLCDSTIPSLPRVNYLLALLICPFPLWNGYMYYHHIQARSLLRVVLTSYAFSHRIGFSVYCLPPQRWDHTHISIWRFYIRSSWIGYCMLQWEIYVTALSFSRDSETLCWSNSPMWLICIIVLTHVTVKY